MLINFRTILSKKSQLNSDTYLYHFSLLEPKEIDFKPGQYIMLKAPSDKGPVSRLYSIASSNAVKNSFELIVETVPGGIGSNYLFSLKENTEVVFQGPAGMFGIHENKKDKTFLVTGTGIAPIRSMIISNFKFLIPNKISNVKYQIFWGLKNYKDVYLLNEFKSYKLLFDEAQSRQAASFDFKICLSREQNLDMIPEEDRKYFSLGHVDSAFDELTTNSEFYLCGGRNVVESLKQFLLGKNIPQENIVFEKF